MAQKKKQRSKGASLRTKVSKASARARRRVIDAHVGKKISSFRLERKMAQAALAGRLGLTFQAVQKYEKGTTRVAASTLFEIAETLGVEVPAFFMDLPRGDPSVGAQALERAAFAASPEGARVLDAIRSLPPHPPRVTLSAIQALAQCFERTPDSP